MQLSKYSKIFYQFFIALFDSASNFQYFERKDKANSSTIFDIIDCEISCFLNNLKAMF